MKKTILFLVTVLLAFTNIASAQVVFDGGPDGTGTDFFEEANWLDTATGLDTAEGSIDPNPVVIGFDLTIGDDFTVVGEGDGSIRNIRLGIGRTLTLEDNAALSCQVLSGPNGSVIDVVLSDNAQLTVIQNIARTAFDVSGSANLIFTGESPEFTSDSINLSSNWTGSVTTLTPNGGRLNLGGPSGTALFNVATIEGVVASSDDIDSVETDDSIIHTLAVTLLLGDVNLDRTVDFLDIVPFIDVVTGGGDQAEADINGDGAVDFLDIVPFIDILTGS